MVKQYGKSDREVKSDKPRATPEEVEDFHQNSDLDSRPEAQHHTLGPGSSQAAAGNHRHDGGDSELLLTGSTLTGSRGGNVALVSVIQALVKLGARDTTTP